MTEMGMDMESFRSIHKNRKRRGRESPWSKTTTKAENDVTHAFNRESIQDKSLASRLCSLDIFDWKDLLLPRYDRHRMNQRRRTGEYLARKKAFEAQENNGELVHRKRESFSNQAYTKCTF
jgi:hypothetical protein